MDWDDRSYGGRVIYECNICSKSPALRIVADCGGDSDGPYCKGCWILTIEQQFALLENKK